MECADKNSITEIVPFFAADMIFFDVPALLAARCDGDDDGLFYPFSSTHLHISLAHCVQHLSSFEISNFNFRPRIFFHGHLQANEDGSAFTFSGSL